MTSEVAAHVGTRAVSSPLREGRGPTFDGWHLPSVCPWLGDRLGLLCESVGQYTLGFYLDYLALWPAYQIAVDAPNGATSAYS